jgi:hypothetical protein
VHLLDVEAGYAPISKRKKVELEHMNIVEQGSEVNTGERPALADSPSSAA